MTHEQLDLFQEWKGGFTSKVIAVHHTVRMKEKTPALPKLTHHTSMIPKALFIDGQACQPLCSLSSQEVLTESLEQTG